MTKLRLVSSAVILCVALAPAAARAQSRQDLQMMEDVRMLVEQVQQLKSAVAALAEQSKAVNTRLDQQADIVRTNHANDSDTLRAIQSQVDALAEKMNVYALQVNRFGAEIPSLRAGLDEQQKTLNEVKSLLTVPVPTAPADVSAGTAPATGTGLPQSPAAAFRQARSFYASDYALAVQAFDDFIRSFPDATPYLGEANYWLGMSQYQLAKYPAAITAFKAVVDTYKTSEKVPDAYFEIGECYRALGKRAEAIAAYDQVIKLFPESSAALQAKTSKGTIK